MIFCEVCRNWDTPVQGLWPFWPCDPHNPETGTVSTSDIETISKIYISIDSIITTVCLSDKPRINTCAAWAPPSGLRSNVNLWSKANSKLAHKSPAHLFNPRQIHSVILPVFSNVKRPSTAFTLFRTTACWLWITFPIQEQKWHSAFTGRACNLIIKCEHSKGLCLVMVDIWPTKQLWLLEWQKVKAEETDNLGLNWFHWSLVL